MGISNGDGDGGGDRWRWLWGHFPVLVGCRNRDFLSPESPLRWRRRCGTFRGWRLDDLGFLHREDFIGEGARSVSGQGAKPCLGAARGPAPRGGVATLWPLSFSSSGSVSLPVKYQLWLLSRPIPRILIFFLSRTKNRRKNATCTVATC